jgi:hypothetical protein
MAAIMTPEMTKIKVLNEKREAIKFDEIALQGILDRVNHTREKPFSTKTIPELIEFSHMGKPTE